MDALAEKWNRHFSKISKPAPDAVEVLSENIDLLPQKGKALDLACGLGGNALLLAKHGLDVTALDLSSVAITKLNATAKKYHLNIQTQITDVLKKPLPKARYDVICVSNFLDRSICTDLRDALKEQGILFYQTWTQEKIDESGPDNPDFLLKPNELLSLFTPLRIIYYREEGLNALAESRYRNRALLIAKKS